MLNSLRHSLRLLSIAGICVRYDVRFLLAPFPALHTLSAPLWLLRKPRLPAQRGMRLALAMHALGPSFIKFGQSLSTRPDLIGEDVARDLGNLRDRLPPFPTAEAMRIVEESLGQNTFRSFAQRPIAAASIAQVYFAETMSGNAVAVKVLRPGIEQQFAQDIAFFYWAASQTLRRFPALQRLKPVEVVRTFEDSVRLELDLRFEAASAEELRQNMQNDAGIVIPRVQWELTAQRVLTTERIGGIPIHDVAALKRHGHELGGVLETLARAFFTQAFRDGFFHADLHPGNIFVEPDGCIAFVDFGIMGRLDVKTRLFVAEIFHGFLTENYRRVAQVHFEAGYVPAHHSVEQFAAACMAIGKPVMGRPLKDISMAQLLGQLFQVTEMFDMQTQPQLLLLQKTMVVVEGVGRMLNPQVNMWQMIEPTLTAWADTNLSPPARLRRHAQDVLDHLRHLPQILSRLEKTLEKAGEE